MKHSARKRRHHLVLWWDGTTGGAVCDGMTIHHLPRKPRVLELDVCQLDYAPNVGKGWIWVIGEPEWRPLTAEESTYIAAALERMVKRGISEIC